MRIPGTGITATADRLVVRSRAAASVWLSPYLGVAVLRVALVRQGGETGSVLFLEVLGGLFVLTALAIYGLLRLSADKTGVRPSALSRRIPWEDVASVRVAEESGRCGTARRIQITCTDGRVSEPLVTLAGQFYGYSFEDVDRIAQRLNRLRRHSLRIVDSPELVQALAAATSGDPRPIDQLLASGAITPEEHAERLHELADAGQVDLETLRLARRAHP